MPNPIQKNPAYKVFGKGYACRHHKKHTTKCKPYEKWDTNYCDFETWWRFCMQSKNAKQNFLRYRKEIGIRR
jgi:hypothetical protein